MRKLKTFVGKILDEPITNLELAIKIGGEDYLKKRATEELMSGNPKLALRILAYSLYLKENNGTIDPKRKRASRAKNTAGDSPKAN